MKLIIVLVVIGVVIGGAVYLSREATSFDPTQQGKEARAAIKVGMTWQEICNAIGEPGEYRVKKAAEYIGPSGAQGWTIEDGPWEDFDADELKRALEAGELRVGFDFNYNYSARIKFVVAFKEHGKAIHIDDAMDPRELLDYQDEWCLIAFESAGTAAALPVRR